MIRVLGRSTSGNVQKVLFLLEELGIRYTREDYGRQFNNTNTDAYRGMNPTMKVPTLLLIGEEEVISDPATALGRVRRLIPDFEGELVPGCRHDMCSSRHDIVDERVLEFLAKIRRAFA